MQHVIELLHEMIPFKLEFPSEAAPGQAVHIGQWLTVTGIGFLLTAGLIYKFILPMIGNILVERRQNIATAADQVEETLRETADMRNEFRERLERIEDAAEQRMADAVREAEMLREQIVAETRESAAAIVQRGHDEVAREQAKARHQLRAQFVEDVIHAAQYAASRSLDDAQQRRLVDDFVKNVGA